MTTDARRARLVLEEVRALGLDVADLIEAARHSASTPTLAEYIAAAAPTFTRGTCATYVWLAEKDSIREQPASPGLVADIDRHGRERATGVGPLFRRRDGEPITGRDYDRLFARARAVLPWSQRTPVSAHVFRHTAVTTIGRIGGYPIAQAFAGHTPPTVTGRYLHATVGEVAAAAAIMTGEAHPLASDPGRSLCGRRR